nr:DNA adenine methylase [Thermoactinomyces daqus]
MNDKDELIYSFFIILRDNPEGLCKRIRDIGLPTVELWQKLRKEVPKTTLDKAFSLLFFNRTNYSGIYKANPIGGMGQKSRYTIDCRWNADLLCERIMDCSRKLKDVKITCYDYEELLLSPGEDVLIFLDL